VVLSVKAGAVEGLCTPYRRLYSKDLFDYKYNVRTLWKQLIMLTEEVEAIFIAYTMFP